MGAGVERNSSNGQMKTNMGDIVEAVVLSTPNYLHHLEVFLPSFLQHFGSEIQLTVVHSGGSPPVVPSGVELVISERPLGCGAARELARPRTRAPWVLYTDADVTFPVGFYQTLLDEITRAEALCLDGVQLDFKPRDATRWGFFEFLLDRMVILNRSALADDGDWWDRDASVDEWTGNETMVPVSCMQGFGMLLRREAVDAIGGFDRRLDSGEDRDIAARLIKAGGRICMTSKCFVLHSYDFAFSRILRRKSWHGEFSALTSAIHPDLFPGSIVSCLRMMSRGA